MCKQIIFIHSVAGLNGLFDQLSAKYVPAAKTVHIADESIIKSVLRAGVLTPEIYSRVTDHVRWASDFGANVIQVTCSSISPCVNAAKHFSKVPVLKIDEPMAEYAVENYSRIGVIATAPTTLGPTSELVREKSVEKEKFIEIDPVLCEGAYDAWFAGDMEKHDRIVRKCLKDLMNRVEVVLLAQVSMTRVVESLDKSELSVPVLSSPEPAMRCLAKVVNTLNKEKKI